MEDQPRQSSSSIPGASSSSTSTERCDSRPSDTEVVMEGEFNIFNQQQQNGRNIPLGQEEDTRVQSDSEQSASYISVLGNNYYVFLSFRGPDTRTGFSDHLYHRLVDVGLHRPGFVFRDDEELRFGQPLGDNLLDAIERSKISIPVISETYAASEWCLREIIKIMDCVERGQQKVYPVLYKVEPKDVRFMRGEFGDAFRLRKHRFDKEVKRKGREALEKVVERRIYESEKVASGHEGKFIKELVETILREQQHEFPLSLPKDLIGIDDHVAKVMNLADIASSETRIIVIYGIGGIGKTTLATIIYKKLFDKFACHSRLSDIRETIKSKGMDYVQSLLISDITKSSVRTVRDSGIEMIRFSCGKKKVLILLDDVDSQDHLDNLIGGCDFELGSRIIITCRDGALLKPAYKGYELTKMNMEEALLLFRKYAFEGIQPSIEPAALSKDIVDTTGGVPLYLKIIGSFLKGKDENIWIETLEKLKKVPNKDVQKTLWISYDSLGYEEQQMFLDIACFFIGIDKRIAIYLWKDLLSSKDSELDRLIELSLVKIDDDNALRMHDHLRDLGRAIACPAEKKPWECSRLWDEGAITIQRSKEENKYIEALRLDKEGSSMFMKRNSFKRMPYLKFLRLSEVDFVGDFENSLSELRWLVWEKCRGSFTATNVHLEKLLILDLSGGYICHEWSGWTLIKMEGLTVLNLSGCADLKKTPDLSLFKKLERLVLENCENLEEIHPSIRYVERLVSLNLRRCGSLKVLPAEVGELKELEELVVDKTNIQEIPPCIESLGKLKMLSAVVCRRLTRVGSSMSSLVSLSSLNLSTCKKLQALPDSLVALGKLQRLSLARCYLLEQIPTSIGKLGELVELDLSSTGIKELPPSIGELSKLETLRVSNSDIETLPRAIGQLKSLQELDASGCRQLKGVIVLDKGGLYCLSTLRLGSAKISGFPERSQEEASTLELHELSALQHLDLLYCSDLLSLPKPPSRLSSLQLTCQSLELQPLSCLNHLKKLTLHTCMSLQKIPELPSGIRKLRVCKCPKLECLSDLPKWNSLLELELLQCYGLRKLDGLEALTSLRKLDVSTSTELSNLQNFEDLESLRDSDIQSYDEKADHLLEIGGLDGLKTLKVLNISGRKHIRQLDLSQSEQLKQLIVNNCESLDKINFHINIKSLERFDTDGCKPHIPDSLARDRT